jgi:hypothetical protein
VSEGYPGAGGRSRGRDRDFLPETESESSVFGSPVGSRPPDQAPYPYETEVQDQPQYPHEPTLPQRPAYPGGPPQPPPPGYPGEPGQPGPSPYPGQVHVPEPPPAPPQPPPGPYDQPMEPRPRRPRPQAPDRQGREQEPRRSPGLGLPFGAGTLFGVAGLVCFVLALMVLPWFRAGGFEVTLSDIRTGFTVPETQPEDIPGAGDGASTTQPEGIPSPDQVGDTVEQEVRGTAAEAAANAIDAGKARYLELYAETLWVIAAVGVALAVLFSTILTPRSFALSLLLGFRRLSGFVTILAGAAHGAALWIVFTGDGAPNPSFGVWLGIGGLAAVLIGCILGPKRSAT